MMIKRGISLVVLWAIAALPVCAQTSDSNKLDAILKELQEIRKLLQAQQVRAAAPPPPADVLPTSPIDVAGKPFKGSAGAKIAVVEFSDFQCPFCGRYVSDTYPQLVREYINTGKVKYVWRDYPLESIHPNAFKAAEAAQCAAEQDRFWEMHDVLFANNTNLGADQLPKHADAARLDAARFQQCMSSGRQTATIRKDMDLAGTLGVNGTPSFFIGVVQPNGSVKVTKKLVGARPFADFKSAIDSVLAPAAGGTP